MLQEQRSPDRRVVLIVVFALFLGAALILTRSGPVDRSKWVGSPFSQPASHRHPIDALLEDAKAEFERVARETYEVDTVEEAAKRYRARRGRHPPPHFDQWVQYAQERQSPLHEEFFDRIYHDLNPFWALKPQDIRYMATHYAASWTFRNGTARFRNSKEGHHYNGMWNFLWTAPFEELAPHLPDLDMAMNEVDEPRVTVPWEVMNELMTESEASKHTRTPTPNSPVRNSYATYANLTEDPEEKVYDWHDDEAYWNIARQACHPDSDARHSEFRQDELEELPDFDSLGGYLYVKNYTNSRNVCENAYIRQIQGCIIKPASSSTTRSLFPLFSASKMAGVNNDILLPSAMYWEPLARFAGGTEEERNVPWEQKKDLVFWRGAPSGGESYNTTWTHFHRQRLVAMTNGSLVSREEQLRPVAVPQLLPAAKEQAVGNFPIPREAKYPLAALKTRPTSLGKWVDKMADTGFVSFSCKVGPDCEWMYPWYNLTDQRPMEESFVYKYLPDADGMAYSGRYRAFLRSTSVPLKATIYSEWHDTRLVPWHHFIPMDNSFRELYGIMEYFMGFDPDKVFGPGQGPASTDQQTLFREAHDEEARKIAIQGRDWAYKVLREEDMKVYIYRLLLEYARICDDGRADMGWTGDLV